MLQGEGKEARERERAEAKTTTLRRACEHSKRHREYGFAGDAGVAEQRSKGVPITEKRGRTRGMSASFEKRAERK